MNEINSSQFNEIISQKGITVIDFFSTECPPCEALAPKLEYLANLYNGFVNFYKIFRQGNRELANSLNVSSSPTLLFFKDGKMLPHKLNGGIKKSQIINILNSLLTENEIAIIKSRYTQSYSNYDVAIIGGGPAGLSAAIYLTQAKLKTVVIDTNLPGGQVATTHLVSNYPGFPQPINGYMLSHYFFEQAKNNGTDFRSAVDISHVDLLNKKIIIDETETITAKKILIASGTSPKPLNIVGEKEFKGNGISYCATCDAKYYENKEVVVIGGGNSAIEESLFLTKFVSKLTIIHQFNKLTANADAQHKAMNNQKISFIFNSEPREFKKQNNKMIIIYENIISKELNTISADGIFVFVGMKPNLDIFKNANLKLDNYGYIVTDNLMHTSIPDVFAAGDIISKKYRQITTATADGTIAAIAIAEEIDK